MSPADHDDSKYLLDHEYDGIQEYDNPLPGWWTWLFIVTIAFSAVYWLYYHIGVGPSLEQKYDNAVAVALERQFASLGALTPTDETILRLLRDEPDKIAALRGMFQGKCGQCHGAAGEGNNIGPNMTDEAFKNIKRPSDFITVITNGVPGKAMAPWGNRLREPQIILLATYVASLRGTFAPNGKDPEGSTIPPWSSFETTPEATDVEETPPEATDEEETPPDADG